MLNAKAKLPLYQDGFSHYIHAHDCFLPSTGVVPCYPSLQMQGMRDARELHADLKRTASLEAMHQQQVEAEEQQSVLEETHDGLGASLSSAVKLHLGFGKKGSKGGTLPRGGGQWHKMLLPSSVMQ